VAVDNFFLSGSGGLNQFRRGYIEVGENDCLPAEEDDFLL
jgi:hypothetical protein